MCTRLPFVAVCFAGLLLNTTPVIGQQPGIRVVRTRAVPIQPAQAQAVEVVDQAAADRTALEAAGLKADKPAGLLNYIHQRTLSDADLSKIQAVIKRLGSDNFEERLKASAEVEHFGPAAVGPLRTAAEKLNRSDADTDYEIAYRASECLRHLEKVPHAAVSAAVVRALAKTKPAGTAQALLAFLPLADDEAVADGIRATLIAVAGGEKPALVAALTDSLAVRRAAAAVALLKGNAAGERTKNAYAKVLVAAEAETDPDAKFRMLDALLTINHEKKAVGQLIRLLPDLPRGRLWQAEDYLRQLAGPNAPKAVFGKSKESLIAAHDVWKSWWAKADASTDLTKFTYVPRITGKTLLVMMDSRFGRGVVAELGPDLKERWRISGLTLPMDAQYLSNGSIAIAEQGANRVTVRDVHGRILATRSIIIGPQRIYGSPQHVQVLPNGNLMVTCRNLILEFQKGKDEPVMQYNRPNNTPHDIVAARRLPNGETIVLLQNGNQCIFLDKKSKVIPGKTLKTGVPNYRASHIAATEDANHVLITELNQVAEYDLKTGKSVWTKAVNQPFSVQRLPNGNTLVVHAEANAGPNRACRLVEFAPDGTEVWSYQPTEPGQQVFRAYRR